MTLVITHQSYLQVQRLSWLPVIWPLDMTGEQQYLTLNNISQNPCHWYNINRPVISTGTMSVLMGCHMTSQVMSLAKFFTTDIAFEPVTLMFLLVTTNQEDTSWCLWPFWELPDMTFQPKTLTPNSSTTSHSNQNLDLDLNDQKTRRSFWW